MSVRFGPIVKTDDGYRQAVTWTTNGYRMGKSLAMQRARIAHDFRAWLSYCNTRRWLA